jgi:hypothetical protein
MSMMSALTRVMTSLLLYGAALALSPIVAFAHESGAARGAGDEQLESRDVAHASITASCPGESGHACGCGKLDALARAGEPTTASSPRSLLDAILPTLEHRLTTAAGASSLLSFSSARPRAPPQAV